MSASLECRIIELDLAEALGSFFSRLVAVGTDKLFHPHPFTREEALRIANYAGSDLYYALTSSGDIIAYGILRGWDDGFEVPSLGITVDPGARGRGYGRLLMQFLHAAARHRGAKQIRLKVYPDNIEAIALYESLGYHFAGHESGQFIGLLDL